MEFEAHGISARHLDSDTPAAERRKILRDFRNGVFDVLNNVDILTTGYDEPSVETVVINRATKSVPLWLQMCGRGSRLFPGKDFFTIIDQGGNTLRLGFWEQQRVFNLDHKQPTGDGLPPVKYCPEEEKDPNGVYGCGKMLHASVPSCDECGYEFPKKKKEELEGDLVALHPDADLPEHLQGVAFSTMNIIELEEVRKIRKYKLGWIVRIIQNRTDITLEQYAAFKGYKSGWVERQKSFNR
jgi:hypothetical protein